MSRTSHILINGDARRMSLIPDKSVHLIITSPPYWQLKDYGDEKQIGFNDSYETYINHLNLVWMECFRVLHDGCRMCINIGDQFARAVYYGRYKVIPIRTEIIRFCETLGMDYMGAVIWQKQTTMHSTGGGVVMGSFPYPRNGILKIDYEFILLFKKLGKAPIPSKEQKAQSILSKEEWNSFFSSHWYFPGARQDGHLAVFPEELPARLIKMFSFTDETVLDPFMGSGTTALAACNLNRNSIGYEINSDYIDYYKQKLNVNQQNIFTAKYHFLTDDSAISDWKSCFNNLPYIYHDPSKMDKKTDIKKLFYGSVVDKNSLNNNNGQYFKVKEVINENTLRLDNDIVIKLIGIKQKENVSEAAKAFIKEKVKGHKVFMRYDDVKYDGDNYLLCYLFLENKTFINAHIIKAGLAEVDKESEYKYKEKFIRLQQYGK